MKFEERIIKLRSAVASRIMMLDGALGTLIQTYKLSEEDWRGEQFADWPQALKGNNDLLCLTRPELILGIHEQYLKAGADIILTNTFNANQISQADYGLEEYVVDINRAAGKLAREAADRYTEMTPERPRFVAGSLGPTNRTASISPDVDRPGLRNTNFDQLYAAYKEASGALIDGGVDILLLETIFDTLNAKAALFAINDVIEQRGKSIPVMVSGTVTDMSGRNLSGQTVEAFWHSIRHVKPFSVGLNCAFGANHLRPHLKELARVADTYICAYPNAGLPNHMGEYDEGPKQTASFLRQWAEEGIVNIIGGCCGTTPAHIKSIASSIQGIAPREIPETGRFMRLSGLEALTLRS